MTEIERSLEVVLVCDDVAVLQGLVELPLPFAQMEAKRVLPESRGFLDGHGFENLLHLDM
jgi:hypothetical protein